MAYYKCGGSGKIAPDYISFNGCPLNTLDVSWLDTSNITSMNGMFQDCENLQSLDISHFDTSKVTDMGGMFWDCQNLTSLDLSNFDVSELNVTNYMFTNCYDLTSLDLSNFTCNIPNMTYMFGNCTSLMYLDISGMEFTRAVFYYGMFSNVPTSCTILVKDAAAQSWLSSEFPDYTFTIKS